ncbi:hypothetical protein M231_00198 [Tremella mesenterica]|uniref:Nucleoporin p58/p45 n=1 Tax=Tremella mesenterica TaxID=5217 RepID=A0A4Q1BWU6_TREME|nr:hypothetical protein M231_00198 [Tremella mesenterica]
MTGSNPFSLNLSNNQSSQTTQAAQTQPAGGGFSFPSLGQNNQQQQTSVQNQPAATSTSAFSFGNKLGQSTTAPAPGGFSFGTPQNGQGTTGGFGITTAKPTTNFFGTLGQPSTTTQTSSLLGQPQPQQQPTSGLLSVATNQLQSSTSAPLTISKTTKFSELPENMQKNIEQVDSWIKEQKKAGEGLLTEPLGRAIYQTSGEVKAAMEEGTALTQGLAGLHASLSQLRAKFVAEEDDLRRIAEIWETYKSVDGRPGAIRVAAHRDFPQDFFSRVAAAMEERVIKYRKTISAAIATTINNHQNALLTLAAQLEGLQSRMASLRATFAETYRERTGSMRDPFDVAREEKGLTLIRT